MHKAVFAAVVVALLSACGFAPRGALQVPPAFQPLEVQSEDPFNPVATALRRAFARAGATTDNEVEARSTLRLVSEAWSEGPLMVDNRARVQEYATRYSVVFELVAADGTPVVAQQEIALSREYAYDAAAAFGTAEEQQVIREELQRDMAAAILRRIDAALGAR